MQGEKDAGGLIRPHFSLVILPVKLLYLLQFTLLLRPILSALLTRVPRCPFYAAPFLRLHLAFAMTE